MLLARRDRFALRAAGVQPIYRSRGAHCQAAAPNKRQGMGRPIRSETRYFRFSRTVRWNPKAGEQMGEEGFLRGVRYRYHRDRGDASQGVRDGVLRVRHLRDRPGLGGPSTGGAWRGGHSR